MVKKSKFKGILISFVFGVLFGCSSAQNKQINKSNYTINDNKQTNINDKQPPKKEVDDDSELLKYLYDKTKDYSEELPIQKNKYKEQDIEVRVWLTYEVESIKRIIIKKKSGKWSAKYLSTKNKRTKEVNLGNPKSGWELFWKHLEEQKISSNLDDSLVGAVEPFEESEEVIIESFVEGLYRHYSYNAPRFSENDEGKRVVKILEIISNEFGIEFSVG